MARHNGGVTDRVGRGRGRPAGGQLVADRERMLDAAERVIRRDGSGASVDAIALEADVTKPVVYARVGSRAALSDALATRLTHRLIAAAQAAVDGSRFDRTSLATVFSATLETIGANRELFLYVTRGSAGDSAERPLYLAEQSAAPFVELLKWWRQQQGLGADVAVPWAYGIVGMLNMVALWWLGADRGPVGPLADQLAELVWSGIGAEG